MSLIKRFIKRRKEDVALPSIRISDILLLAILRFLLHIKFAIIKLESLLVDEMVRDYI